MKKSADPIIQEKESANSAYKQSEMFLKERHIVKTMCLFRSIFKELQKIFAKTRENMPEGVLWDLKFVTLLLTGEGYKSVKDKKRRYQYGKACRY